MKIRILGLVVGVSALAMWGTACEQPQIDCRVLHGEFAAKYTLVSGGPECSSLAFDKIGVQSYYGAKADPAYTGQQTVDLSRSVLAIRTSDQAGIEGECGDYGDDACVVSSSLNAVGDFRATEPDEKDACSIRDVMTSEISVNAIPPGDDDPETPEVDYAYPGRDATNKKYEWKNVRVLTTPANPGNLIEAELTYTENGCTATYNMIAVAPLIACGSEGLDGNGEPIGDPDDNLCDDKADPTYGLGFGSGISPDVKAKCDPIRKYCVATNTTLIEGGP